MAIIFPMQSLRKGFTLIESVFVLLIISIVLLLVDLNLQPVSQDIAYVSGLQSFKSAYELAQLNDILFRKPMFIKIVKNKIDIKDYQIKDTALVGTTIFLPEGATANRMITELMFKGTGYVQPMTIIFRYKERENRFVINIGSGTYVWK